MGQPASKLNQSASRSSTNESTLSNKFDKVVDSLNRELAGNNETAQNYSLSRDTENELLRLKSIIAFLNDPKLTDQFNATAEKFRQFIPLPEAIDNALSALYETATTYKEIQDTITDLKGSIKKEHSDWTKYTNKRIEAEASIKKLKEKEPLTNEAKKEIAELSRLIATCKNEEEESKKIITDKTEQLTKLLADNTPLVQLKTELTSFNQKIRKIPEKSPPQYSKSDYDFRSTTLTNYNKLLSNIYNECTPILEKDAKRKQRISELETTVNPKPEHLVELKSLKQEAQAEDETIKSISQIQKNIPRIRANITKCKLNLARCLPSEEAERVFYDIFLECCINHDNNTVLDAIADMGKIPKTQEALYSPNNLPSYLTLTDLTQIFMKDDTGEVFFASLIAQKKPAAFAKLLSNSIQDISKSDLITFSQFMFDIKNSDDNSISDSHEKVDKAFNNHYPLFKICLLEKAFEDLQKLNVELNQSQNETQRKKIQENISDMQSHIQKIEDSFRYVPPKPSNIDEELKELIEKCSHEKNPSIRHELKAQMVDKEKDLKYVEDNYKIIVPELDKVNSEINAMVENYFEAKNDEERSSLGSKLFEKYSYRKALEDKFKYMPSDLEKAKTDIILLVEKLAQTTDKTERKNIEKEINNKKLLINDIEAKLKSTPVIKATFDRSITAPVDARTSLSNSAPSNTATGAQDAIHTAQEDKWGNVINRGVKAQRRRLEQRPLTNSQSSESSNRTPTTESPLTGSQREQSQTPNIGTPPTRTSLKSIADAENAKREAQTTAHSIPIPSQSHSGSK